MGMALLILVVLAAVTTVASGVWVATALMAAIGRTERRSVAASDEDDSHC